MIPQPNPQGNRRPGGPNPNPNPNARPNGPNGPNGPNRGGPPPSGGPNQRREEVPADPMMERSPVDAMRELIPGDLPEIQEPQQQNQVDDRGYNFEFVHPPSDDLKCAICNHVARDAMETECIHTFCQKCCQGIRQCPKCDEKGSELNEDTPSAPPTPITFAPSKILRRRILALVVNCPKNCPAQVKIGDLETHLPKCAGIPRSVFENDVKIAMRSYVADMEALQKNGRELKYANLVQSKLVAEMRQMVSQQQQVIEDLRKQVSQLMSESEEYKKAIAERVTKQDFQDQLREEREVVIMPLFRAHTQMQEEQTKQQEATIASVVERLDWLEQSLTKRIEWTVQKWSTCKPTILSPEFADGQRVFRGHVQKGSKEREDQIGMYLRYEQGPLPLSVDWTFAVLGRDRNPVEQVKRSHKWVSHSGVGYDSFTNISNLKANGAYDKAKDCITFRIEFLVRRSEGAIEQ